MRTGVCAMQLRLKMACCGLVLAPTLCVAQNVFDGTWRPDPQKASPNQPPDEVIIMNGQYECRSCKPPYTIAADGKDHEVKSSPYYNSLSISIIDAHTVAKTAKKDGVTVASVKES